MGGIYLRGSVDRTENDISIIVWDNGKVEDIKGLFLKEGDRVAKVRGKIKLLDNKAEKEKMSALQDKIFKRR